MPAVTAQGSFTQTIIEIIPLPPEGPPGLPPQIVFGSITRTLTESQSLALHIIHDQAFDLTLRTGVAWGSNHAWVSAGYASERVEVSYDLPVLNTFATPIPATLQTFAIGPPFPIPALPPSLTLAAEQRSAQERLNGWTAGVGLERTSGRLALGASYAYADYGSVDFADSARVTGLHLSTATQVLRLSLTALF